MTRRQSYFTIAIMCVALVLLAANAVVSVHNIRLLGDRAYWVEHTQSVLMDLETVRAEVSKSVSSERAYLLSGDSTFLNSSTEARQSTSKLLADVEYLVQDNSRQIPRIARLKQLSQSVFANLDQSTALVRRSPSFNADANKLVSQGQPLLDDLRSTIVEMIDAENTLLKQRRADSEHSLEKTIVSVAVASIAATGMVLLAFVTLRLSVRSSIKAAIEQNRLANYNTLLVNSTGEGMYGVDLAGNCTFINKAGEKILGVRAADVVGKRMHDLTHHHKPDGTPYPASECPIYKAYITGEGTRVDNELFFRADGTAFPVEYTANPIIVGRRTDGAVVSFNDITQRLKNDAERRESGERAQALADNIPQLAWMADGQGGIFWYNRRWFDFTGTTLDEMKSLGWKRVHHPDYLEPTLKKYTDAIATGTAWEDTFPLRGKDGNYRWFLSRATPILDEGGKVLRWFGSNTDITEQREIQQALIESQEHLRKARDDAEEARAQAEEAQAQAEAANVAKSQFLANMSHELRTPLNAVIMYSELLQEEAQDRGMDDFIPDLEKIRNGGKHLLSLVNGVLDLSKIEAGKMELYLETFDIKTMIDEVASTVKPLIDRRGNTLVLDIPADIGPLYADLTKVRQFCSTCCPTQRNSPITET